MSRSGLKWSAVGLVCLLLVAVGAHFAWGWRRYRDFWPVTDRQVHYALG
jgi:protein-S-isoprenylcysteine O-methyltransferase Ste14